MSSGEPPPGVLYFERHFNDAFMDAIDALRTEIPVSLASGNMRANRRFLRDANLAKNICERLPSEANVLSVCSDIRFIEYDEPGGYIQPHVDGTRVCEHTGLQTTHSMLVWLSDVPEDEGGETDFLRDVTDEDSVLYSIRPKKGSVVIFRHDSPHVGRCVGVYPKLLLRGDMTCAEE